MNPATVALPWEQPAFTPEARVPVVAGGQDIPIPWLPPVGYDWLTSIFRGGASLPDKLGDAFNTFRSWTWGHIGGGLRWLYDRTADFFVWWFTLLDLALDLGFGNVNRWAGFLAGGVVDHVAHWGGAAVDTVVGWSGAVIDRVQIAAGNVLTGATWLAHATWDLVVTSAGNVLDGTTWLAHATWDAITTAAGNVLAGVTWLSNATWDRLTALGGAMLDLFSWLEQRTVSVVGGAVGLIADGFRNAFEWFVDHTFGVALPHIDTKLSVMGKLVRAEYGSLEELWDDISDPWGDWGPFFGPLGMILTVAVASVISIFAVAGAYARPAVNLATYQVEATIPTTGQILDGWNRGFLDDSTAREWLRTLGYPVEARDLFDGLRHQIPGASDLVRMVVREAFSEDQAQRLGFVTPTPGDFVAAMEAQGFAPVWSDRYWWAHWELPSPTQLYEMLHRGQASLEDVRGALVAADFPPRWIDPLINIAYTPLTRVDIRRFYRAGLLTFDQVVARYQAIGYTPEDATIQAQFAVVSAEAGAVDPLEERRDDLASIIRRSYKRRTIDRDDALDRLLDAGFSDDEAEWMLAIDDVALAVNPAEEADVDLRDLSVPVILAAYRERVWTRDQAQRELELLGFLPASADLQLSLEDHKGQQAIVALQTGVVEEEYKSRAIDLPAAQARLTALGFDVQRRDLTLQRWDLELARKTRRLTPTQVLAAWEAGIFADLETIAELETLGYTRRDALILMALRSPPEEVA